MLPVIDRRIQNEFDWRNYMADALHAIGHLNFRYADTIQEKNGTENNKTAPVEKSETEIIDHISDMLDKMEKANECI